MKLEDLDSKIQDRFDRVEDKLDSHLDRIAKNEAGLEWIKGHLKISLTFLFAGLGGAISFIIKFLLEKS